MDQCSHLIKNRRCWILGMIIAWKSFRNQDSKLLCAFLKVTKREHLYTWSASYIIYLTTGKCANQTKNNMNINRFRSSNSSCGLAIYNLRLWAFNIRAIFNPHHCGVFHHSKIKGRFWKSIVSLLWLFSTSFYHFSNHTIGKFASIEPNLYQYR